MIKALFFDQDGVIVDTERDGHRVAFNQTFAEFGYRVDWSVERYHELLQIGGGKERMLHHLKTTGFGVPVAPEEEKEVIQKLHLRKTDVFIELLERGRLPLRPGVHRLMREAQATERLVGVCTTSNERSAAAITGNLLSDIRFAFILAGDVVKRKKPDPEIYKMALERAGLLPHECVVIEDSNIGCRAAKAAGCHVIATVNGYTREEDLSMADIVVSDLGEPGSPAELIRSSSAIDFKGIVDLPLLQALFA